MSYPAAKQPGIPARILAAGVCAAAGLVVFQFFGNATRGYVDTPSVFWWWISQWLNPQAESEHGWLVLALSGWLLWHNLKSSPPGPTVTSAPTSTPPAETVGGALRPEPLWPAALAMAAALALHAAGFAAQFTRASIVAALLFTWGVLRLAGGRRWGAAAVFPLGFMLFAIPVSVLDEVGLPLRLWVVAAGDWIAHAAGIDVVRSGTQLLAPDGRYNYDVAAACSGVRSLLALAALAVLLGYLSFRSGWRRLVVALVCLPLVYLGNVARIVAIVFAAEWGGSVWGDRAHAVMGWGVFAIVLGGVLATVALLQRLRPEPVAPVAPVAATETTTTGSSTATALYFTAASITALALTEMVFLSALRRLPAQGAAGIVLAADGVAPVELPAFIGLDWAGRRTEVTAIERAVLPPDTGFSRKLYVSLADTRQQVLLSIVLSGRDRSSIHRPELCLVGQGWTITGKTEHRFSVLTPSLAREALVASAAPAAGFPATILRVRRDVPTPRGAVTVPSLVAYWFVNADAVVATHPQRVFRDMWNRLAHGRIDRWAYVLLQVDATDGEPAALARMQAILDGTLPAFQRATLSAPIATAVAP